MNIEELEQEQLRLSKQLDIPQDDVGYFPRKGDILFSFDVQYASELAHVAIDVQEWQGEMLGTFVQKHEIPATYVPSFFAFREGPVLLKTYESLLKEKSFQPDLLLVDGHGLAHPRRFGVACWLGLKANLPTLGCAKQTLLKFEGHIADTRGSSLEIRTNNEILGLVVRTQDKTKPVYVSAGHKISLSNAVKVVLELSSRYRIMEPIRRADQAARAFAKGDLPEGWGPPMHLG